MVHLYVSLIFIGESGIFSVPLSANLGSFKKTKKKSITVISSLPFAKMHSSCKTGICSEKNKNKKQLLKDYIETSDILYKVILRIIY